MKMQNYEMKGTEIRKKFLDIRKNKPDLLKKRLKFSWSNWCFGMESLEESVKRLNKYGIRYMELHGNKHGKDVGYRASDVKKVLSDYDIMVAGICGIFATDNDLSSNKAIFRQNAIDYIRRQLDLGKEFGAKYFLIVPGDCGRPVAYDDMEFCRSVETLKLVADEIKSSGIRGAIEPIRSAEVSFCHTVNDAKEYIKAVNNPGVKHINGDVYHMQVEESHIGEAIVSAGSMLTNLHMADSTRGAFGTGSMDLDTIIMALYLIGYNNDDSCFVTAEPLGPGGAPYVAMYGRPDPKNLDSLVKTSLDYFKERENEVLNQ